MFSETGLNITFTFSLVPRGWLATGEKNTPNQISPALAASHLPQPPLLCLPLLSTPPQVNRPWGPTWHLRPNQDSKQKKGLPGKGPSPSTEAGAAEWQAGQGSADQRATQVLSHLHLQPPTRPKAGATSFSSWKDASPGHPAVLWAFSAPTPICPPIE